VVYPSFYRFDG